VFNLGLLGVDFVRGILVGNFGREVARAVSSDRACPALSNELSRAGSKSLHPIPESRAPRAPFARFAVFRHGMASRVQFATAQPGPPGGPPDSPRCRESEPGDGTRGFDHLVVPSKPCAVRVSPTSPIYGLSGWVGGGASAGCRLRRKLLIALQSLIHMDG
jgi:hypothetical protein